MGIMFWQLFRRRSTPLNINIVWLTIFLSLAIRGLFVPSVSAGELKDTVAFAGVTFQGSTSAIGKRYPYSAKLVEENDLAVALYEKLQAVEPDNVIISGRRLNKDSGHRYAVALMIDREFVEISKYSEDFMVTGYGDNQFSRIGKGMCRIDIQLSAQTVVFDVKDSQIVASLPMNPKIVRKDIRELGACGDTENLIRQNINEMLMAPDLDKPSIAQQFISHVKSLRSPTTKLVQIAVTDVTVNAEKSDPFLPEKMKADDNYQLKQFIAHKFITQLHLARHVAIQPYVVDSSIIAMQGRFYGQDVTYNLTLPEPAFGVSLHLRGFGKKLEDEKPSGKAFNYVSAIDFEVQQLGVRKQQLFQSRIKNGALKVIPVSKLSVDEWAAFRESLNELLEITVTTIHQPGHAKHRMQKFNRAQLRQMIQLEKAYKSCAI